jgi:hypothetical protein
VYRRCTEFGPSTITLWTASGFQKRETKLHELRSIVNLYEIIVQKYAVLLAIRRTFNDQIRTEVPSHLAVTVRSEIDPVMEDQRTVFMLKLIKQR